MSSRGTSEEVSDEYTVFPLLSVRSVSVRTSWLFYEQEVLCQLRGRPLFCRASGSKRLHPGPTYPQRAAAILLYLAFFFSTVGFVNWLTNKATNPHYEQLF